MKKSLSSLDLLKRELYGNSEPKGFFRHFLPSRRYLTVSIPYYEYLRGRAFIEDLRDNFEEEIPFSFGMSELLYFLYDDLLKYIKDGAKHEVVAAYLSDSYKKFFKVKKSEKRVMRPVTKTFIKFETIEEEEDISSETEEEKTAYLTIRMKESELLRGEILLHDLSEFPSMKNLDITVEQVIAIVYLDFIEEIKKEGNSLKLQKSILKYL